MWDVLDTVSLWVDGDMVAEMDASDEDDYQNDEKTIRFSGLNLFAEEDEELDVVIAISVQNNLDNADLSGVSGNFSVAVDSLRYFDADGVAETDSTTPDLTDAVTFTIVEAGADDELIVKTSSNDPDGTTLQLDTDAKSDWYNVFTFDLDTDDSVNDIELTTVVVQVTVTGATTTYDSLVDDAEIVIDGTTIDDVAVAGGATQVATLTFDVDGDVTIDAGDRVAAELMLRFRSLASENEGVTVTAEVTSTNANNFEAEGADDLEATTPDQLRGAAQGDIHTLRTQGVDVSVDGTSAVVTTVDAVGVNDYATYEVSIDVTAFEQDVYVDVDPAVSFASYLLESGASVPAVAGSRSVVLTSTGDEVSGAFEITEGSTETLTLTVTYTPGVSNTAARLQVVDFIFGDTTAATGQTWTASPEEDYRTAVVTMVN